MLSPRNPHLEEAQKQRNHQLACCWYAAWYSYEQASSPRLRYKGLRQNGGTLVGKGPCFANIDILKTSDPLNVQHILIKNFANYPKGPDFKTTFEPLGDAIFACDSDSWETQKKVFQLLIGQNKFELFVQKTIQRKLVDGLLPILDQEFRYINVFQFVLFWFLWILIILRYVFD